MQDATGLEAMRRKMSEALAQKQQAKAAGGAGDTPPTGQQTEAEMPSSMIAQGDSSSEESVTTTDSARTIRAGIADTPGSVRTPSYPFPRMQMKLNRLSSHRSAPSHKPFTLLSPTNEPVGVTQAMKSAPDLASSDMDTPTGHASALGQAGLQHQDYPMPDLYDTILMLNAEPGLEMWWANVCDILSEAYGADRASLALPGDVTDLENVPWGQKASFNLAGSDGSGLSQLESLGTSEFDFRTAHNATDASSQDQASVLGSRPPLQTRHSIAGVLPEFTTRPPPRPTGPLRANSSIATRVDNRPLVPPRLTRQEATPQSQPAATVMDAPSSATIDLNSEGGLPPRCHVFKSLQPLEQDQDPLLIRSGVASLFGKTRPVVLTRTYSGETTASPRQESFGENRPFHTSLSERRGKRLSVEREDKPLKVVDEYEQPEPSLWSQSPSPSPAAVPDPTESPFFNQTSSVDETAFEKDPPVHDYSAAANQSLNAIGGDGAKSVIHVPLIQPVYARGAMASTLRFPIAILSFNSTLHPYPLTLRQSLLYFLPHLASSFSLAQQYSNLQDRVRGGVTQRHGAAFGMGGTFSDEGSELELVAELSGQVSQEKEQFAAGLKAEGLIPERGSIRESPASSLNTPLHEHTGFGPATPGRSGTEMVEGYFSAKRQRGGKAITPGSRRSADIRTDTTNSSRASSGRERVPLKEPTVSYSPRPGSQTSESEYGDVSGALDRLEHGLRRSSQPRGSLLKDDAEKPLPELISSLMLNAVPLQLFLAKPTSGDLVWTNRKFDAFRSQGEGRVRDPWKNVHHDDRNGLTKLWSDALRTGSQFTHYIRVKRFNFDSDFRWFVFRASTLLSNNGRLLYWIGSFLDVHEQYIKNLEASEKEALMARDAKVRAMADAIPQVLFEAIEGEGIVAVNQQWHTFSGQTIDDAKGLGFARHVHRDDLHKCGVLSPIDVSFAKLSIESDSSSSSSSNRTIHQPTAGRRSLFAPDQSALENMIKQGSVTEEQDENGRLSYLTEVRLRSKGGEYRWFLVRLVRVDPALLASGRASWYGTCTDIETRKVLERELSQANEKVHSEMEGKTKFFANMSHEIRTPLNGILGSMPWLTESTLDLDQRRTVDTIQNSANNLRELVDNILDVTKVEAGKMTLLPKFFHVRTLCEEVIDTVSSRAIERGLELNYSLDANVPFTVKGDPFRLRQVLLNLLGNSVKFTEQGEVYMHCTFRNDPTPSPGGTSTAFLAFEVIDTGRGFNVGDFKRLFKQFGQIGSGSNHDAGSGLGLFLSKQLVEMHGGELTVRSQAGEGSTFSFYIKVGLPATADETSPQAASSAVKHRQSSSMSARSQSADKTPIAGVKSPAPSSSTIQTPGLSRYITSPDESPDAMPVGSPGMISPPVTGTATTSTQPSLRSDSISIAVASPASSLIPTPDSQKEKELALQRHATTDRQTKSEQVLAMHSALRRTRSDNDSASLSVNEAHPTTYSIVVICPAENARLAIKQHIEHVVPLQIPTIVTTLGDIGSFLALFNGPTAPTFTHVVLDIPASSDVMLFMRQLTSLGSPPLNATVPALVIVTDHYQKRDIQEDFQALAAIGRKAFLIHKPVKPSVFAMIFDPAQLRNLSKDRTREVAQSSRDDFRNTALSVKDAIGNKGHRVLLVEDSDVNRKVIWRYLVKVGLSQDADEARDGVECLDLVLRKRPPGWYSLIICDIQMPNKNGLETCKEIREWEQKLRLAHQQPLSPPSLQKPFSPTSATAPQLPATSTVTAGLASAVTSQSAGTAVDKGPIPIMALTANAMPEERQAAAVAGFSDYLTKPVDFNLLGAMLMKLLRERERGQSVFLSDRALDG